MQGAPGGMGRVFRPVYPGGIFCAGLLCCAVMSGCSDMSRVDRDVRALDRKLGDLRGFQAEQAAQLTAIEGRVRELAGAVEALQHGVPRGSVPVSDPAPLALGLRGSEAPALRAEAVPPIVPLATLEADEQAAGEFFGADAGLTFSEALRAVRAARYDQALDMLQRAQVQNRSDSGAALIIFWRGVCADGLGDSRRALAAYGELASDFPRHPRTPLALLRQGSVFIRLGDVRTAKLTLEKLIAEFPRSAEAATARQRLKTL